MTHVDRQTLQAAERLFAENVAGERYAAATLDEIDTERNAA